MTQHDQPEVVRQALEHPCPRCHAPAGIGCARPNGGMLPSHTVHRAREEVVSRLSTDTGPPADLKTAHGREQWRDYADTLRERGDWTPGNRRILLSALRFAEEAENALETAASEPECIGSTGQSVANPQFTVAQRCQARWLTALSHLMLTPAGRVGATSGGSSGGAKGDDLDALDAEAASSSGRSGG